MDVDWLHDFTCLARTLNFSRAAEERNISQSAFSRRIKSLENWLGIPLILRSTYPVQLSQEGYEFLPIAQATINTLLDTRQNMREVKFGRSAFQRIATLPAISANYLTRRIREIKRDQHDLRVRVYSDYLPNSCQLFADGTCDFLLCYRHNNGAPYFDEGTVDRKDILVERFVPVGQAEAASDGGWNLSSNSAGSIPYLSYDPASYLGTIVEQIIGPRQPNLVLQYMVAQAEALKRSALAGSGVAWLSDLVIRDELESGKLVCVGGPEWQTELCLTAFCFPDRLDRQGQLFWEAL